MSAPQRWSKRGSAEVADRAECFRRQVGCIGPDVLAAVIGNYRLLAEWRRQDAESHRATAAHYRLHFHDEAMGQRCDATADEHDRNAVRLDRIADRLERGDLPPGVFRDDEVGP